jgi:hypothetical protein
MVIDLMVQEPRNAAASVTSVSFPDLTPRYLHRCLRVRTQLTDRFGPTGLKPGVTVQVHLEKAQSGTELAEHVTAAPGEATARRRTTCYRLEELRCC